MEINLFLKQFIEGYLFCDVEEMLKIEIKESQKYGKCGYPIMMSVLSVMELLGNLTCKTTLKSFNEDKSQGSRNFEEFWNSYFCLCNPKYKGSQEKDVFRLLIRNGLAHSYLTLPGIYITVGNPEQHWGIDYSKNEIYIDAKEFYNDFKKTYESLIKNNKEVKIVMQNRLNDLSRLYAIDSDRVFKKINSKNKKLTFKPLRSPMISGASTMWSPAITVPSGIKMTSTPASAFPCCDEMDIEEMRKITKQLKDKTNL